MHSHFHLVVVPAAYLSISLQSLMNIVKDNKAIHTYITNIFILLIMLNFMIYIKWRFWIPGTYQTKAVESFTLI
jgi:hypothetical protein